VLNFADIGAATMNGINIDPARKIRLSKVAQEIREISTGQHGDLEVWRISKLLRDAVTTAQADEAEARFLLWRPERAGH
jgi:hypothetical protein